VARLFDQSGQARHIALPLAGNARIGGALAITAIETPPTVHGTSGADVFLGSLPAVLKSGSPAKVWNFIRHGSDKMMQKYIHLTDEDRIAAAAVLG
jgi:hypothetical protein